MPRRRRSAARGVQLWGDRFVRQGSDILAVEDEIAERIADSLRLTLTGDERAQVVRRQTQNTEAYHLYLKGLYYWSKRTPPNLKKCVMFFEQAIAIDPAYALAHAGLADDSLEARAASSLNHPNILVIHDFGDIDDRPFIVSELVEGDTLRKRLEGGAVPVLDSVGFGIQVASALAAAHARGIVHRDIKPDNVIVRPDGYVKVVDFGLAKLLDRPSNDTVAETQHGVLLGTPHYMSPEQAEGQDVDERSDLFSLGVVLYELVSGVRPFVGETHVSVLSSILRDTPPPVTVRDPSLPGELDALLARCLAKDRDRRYTTASELRADFEALDRALRSPRRGSPNDGPAARAHIADDHITSLAVLPFANASHDPEAEYLSDGVTESLINRLALRCGAGLSHWITQELTTITGLAVDPMGAFVALGRTVYLDGARVIKRLFRVDAGVQTTVDLPGEPEDLAASGGALFVFYRSPAWGTDITCQLHGGQLVGVSVSPFAVQPCVYPILHIPVTGSAELLDSLIVPTLGAYLRLSDAGVVTASRGAFSPSYPARLKAGAGGQVFAMVQSEDGTVRRVTLNPDLSDIGP